MIKNDITLYDSLSKQRKVFLPISKDIVKIYSCGPTLYRRAHIGNLRGYVFADTLNRLFRETGFRVKHVINLTDVGHLFGDGDVGEDKIEKEARDTNQDIELLITNLIKIFNSDLEHLNIPLKRYDFTRATSYIKEQISLIKRLEKKGFAYKISENFDVQKFKSYGGLAGVSKSIQQEGKRVEIITCFTLNPVSVKSLFKVSAKTYPLKFPMCALLYKVGPQEYIFTMSFDIGKKTFLCFDSESYSVISFFIIFLIKYIML